jgi:hypothetical protein
MTHRMDAHEEPWLREALDGLLADEPPMPPAAIVGDVRRGEVARAVVRRRRAATGAVAATLVAVAVPVGVVLRATPDAAAPPSSSHSPAVDAAPWTPAGGDAATPQELQRGAGALLPAGGAGPRGAPPRPGRGASGAPAPPPPPPAASGATTTSAPPTPGDQAAASAAAAAADAEQARRHPCRASDLAVTLDSHDGAGGTTFDWYAFRNTSGSACGLTGFPTLARGGAALPFTIRYGVAQGPLDPAPVPTAPVLVEPGARALSLVSSYRCDVGEAGALAGLGVTVPGDPTRIPLPSSRQPVCVGGPTAPGNEIDVSAFYRPTP